MVIHTCRGLTLAMGAGAGKLSLIAEFTKGTPMVTLGFAICPISLGI
jgi:hypothetical protein